MFIENEVKILKESCEALISMYTHIRDSVDEESKWYMLVFKPYDDKYESNLEWYKHKGLNSCRSKLRGTKGILTREENAAKVHINALVCSKEPLDLHDKTHAGKYKIYCKEVSCRKKVFKYITKEFKRTGAKLYENYLCI